MQDKVVPAIVDRNNLLMNRLASNLDETASLVERILRREPLPVPEGGPQADSLSDALREVQPALVEAFRGSEDEIGHRLEWYLSLLRDNDPVLDVGCGRGELLLLLREAGVAGSGVEADPALAQGARRRGLEILEGDAVETLRQQPAGSLGAITAIHLMEHLESSSILDLLGEARRALRPGGLFVAECPNPRNLRVGAAEFWIDPTHRRPLLPETLDVFLTTSGFRVDRVEYLHPFPEEQTFVADRVDLEGSAESSPGVTEVARRVDVLAARLDDLLNGPRDFVIVASNPNPNS
jgi:O-antigen chain-terminating methyltransferase